MGYRRDLFAPDEWYHCYTRSVERSLDTRNVFTDAVDSERFLQALHLANGTDPIRRSDLYRPVHHDILNLPRPSPLVKIAAYCLMPTHFHLLLKEVAEGGISKIMQTVGTAFSMYYNIKHVRIGNVFVKPFRSKHVTNDVYFKHLVNYIHLNPAELYEPRWKEGEVSDLVELERLLRSYRFSSLPDYLGVERVECNLLDQETMNLVIHDEQSFPDLIRETSDFYKEYERDF